MAQGSALYGKNSFVTGQTLLLAALFFLPALYPPFFGWLNALIAAPVFYVLLVKGMSGGGIILRNALILAGISTLLVHEIEVFFFSLTLVPLGYSLYYSAVTKQPPVNAGARGFIVLGLSWLIFWIIYGVFAGINPYQSLVTLLDSGFAETYNIYSKSTDLTAETLLGIQQAIDTIRSIIPRILPGMLGCTVLLTVWINQVIGNTVLQRRNPELVPWPSYCSWKLPEQLIWLVIAGAVFVFVGKGLIYNIGINLLLLGGMIYFFQGLAVFLHMLDQWHVPKYVRLLIYVILTLQSYGIIVLAVLGIGDVWIDFRKSKQDSKS